MNTNLTKHIQDGTVKLMIVDKDFLKIGRSLIPQDVFPSEMLRNITKALFSYWDSYMEAPGDDFYHYFYDAIQVKSEDEDLYEEYFDIIYKIKPNKKYISSKLFEYIRFRAYTDAVLNGSDMLKAGNVEEFEAMFFKTLKSKVNINDTGLNFWDFKFTPTEDELVLPTMVKALDEKIGGYFRGELFVWMAPSNVGKSWAMVHSAKGCLLKGINAVYYTLEMKADNIQRRIAMAVTGLRKNKSVEGKPLIIEYLDGSVKDFSKTKSIETNKKLVNKNIKMLKRRGGGVVTKQFIEGKATVAHIESHLDQLEIRDGFVPDIIFVDHLRLLKSANHYNEDKGAVDEITKALRGIAKERNIAVVTVLHANRSGSKSKGKIRDHQAAGSIDIVNLADVILTLNQTEKERARMEMRIYAEKVREGEKWFEVLVKQSFEIGGFCLESELIEKKEEDYDDDKGDGEER